MDLRHPTERMLAPTDAEMPGKALELTRCIGMQLEHCEGQHGLFAWP